MVAEHLEELVNVLCLFSFCIFYNINLTNLRVRHLPINVVVILIFLIYPDTDLVFQGGTIGANVDPLFEGRDDPHLLVRTKRRIYLL